MKVELAGKTWWDWALRVVALIGLVAILVLGAWGIIQLAFGLPDFFGGVGGTASSLFGSSPANTATTTTATSQPALQAESLNVTAPSLATSGQPFTLSWTHQGLPATTAGGAAQYAYQISYSCQSGLSLEAPLPTGSLQSVPCNTPFNYTDATQSLMLTPELAGTKQTPAQFTVTAVALATNTTTTSGAASVTILPVASATGSYSSASNASAPAAKYNTPAAKAAVLYGLPNLTATIVAATPSYTNQAGESVQFLIKNTGTNTASAGWTFSASVPTNALGGQSYQSAAQQALAPGASILYTMSFSLAAVSNTYSPYTTYPNYSNTYPYTAPSACGYTQSYTYNGYANYPSGSTYNCNNSYNNNYSYPNSTYPTYSYPSSRVFSVTANPTNYLAESTTADNTASVSL